MRKSFAIIFAILIAASFSCQVTYAAELTEEQAGTISKDCKSIKQSLKNLQKTDSRTRVYLGSIYQTVLTNFITPLNLRFVRNNIPETSLVDDQSLITSARDNFAHDFITYSQSLEELIATDCQNRPADFYDELEITRDKRATVSEDVNILKQLITDHINTVMRIKEEVNE